MNYGRAIETHSLIDFTYSGHPRVVEPACWGLLAGTKREGLRAHQIGGTSESGDLGWKTFVVSKMKSPHLDGGTFDKIPDGYRRDDPDIKPVFTQL